MNSDIPKMKKIDEFFFWEWFKCADEELQIEFIVPKKTQKATEMSVKWTMSH